MIRRVLNPLFLLVMGIYVFFNSYYFLSKPAGTGDESLFISDLLLVQEQGWWAAIAKGISLPYMLLTYPFTFLMEDVWALRLVNILLLAFLVGYCVHTLKIRSLRFAALLLFVCCTIGYFMVGLNDGLFTVCAVIFFAETYRLIQEKSYRSLIWWGVALVLMIFTRKLWIVFLPGVAFSVFMLWRYASIRGKTLFLPLTVLVLMLLLNVPSFQADWGISYDQKSPPKATKATWAQRQYLAQLQVNRGERASFSHPSWKETDAYLAANGDDSLPASVFSGLTHDPVVTLKEFVKDLGYILVYSVRSVGLLLLTVLGFGIVSIWKQKAITAAHYIPMLLVLMIAVFAFIIISFVELRWLTSLFAVAVIGFWNYSEERQLPNWVVVGNYAVLILMGLYGSYGYFSKISW
ncbi:hypothetical protein [Altibacter sp. HG106]|uniref:hypothetical protein n=1 Tax=Altibacter sp. HG106 TaxID=3023937 RepID=UPI00235041AC|nr:hypothetical protein [Altibacter sp. HG106]MDC7995696.1 hypothetical protein [Altibacter sp. HG106]